MLCVPQPDTASAVAAAAAVGRHLSAVCCCDKVHHELLACRESPVTDASVVSFVEV